MTDTTTPQVQDHGPGCDGPLNCTCPAHPHADCPIGTHDHWTTKAEWLNGNDASTWPGGDDVFTIPRTCGDCGRDAYYDTDDDRYHHVDPTASCFLIPADGGDQATYDTTWRCGAGHDHTTEDERDECDYDRASRDGVDGVEDERDMQAWLAELIVLNEDSVTVSTFDDVGMLTMNKGVVATMPNGAEFQVTIVQSRRAR